MPPGLMVSGAAAIVFETLKDLLSATCRVPLPVLRRGAETANKKVNGFGGRLPELTASWSLESYPGSFP